MKKIVFVFETSSNLGLSVQSVVVFSQIYLLLVGKNTKHITVNKVKITFDNIKIILPTNNTFYVGELLQKNINFSIYFTNIII